MKPTTTPAPEEVTPKGIQEEIHRLIPLLDGRVSKAIRLSKRPVTTLLATLKVLEGLHGKARQSVLDAGFPERELNQFAPRLGAKPSLLTDAMGRPLSS